jgi:hypothetical protein
MATSTKRYGYDYFDIFVPEELNFTDEERGNYAIDCARDAAKIYRIPCVWYVRSDNGVDEVKIGRKYRRA